VQLCSVHLSTEYQVSISTRFGDKLGCTPKLMGSRDPLHAPFLDFFAGFGDIATVRLRTKFQVSTSTRFRDTLGCTPKFMGFM